MRIHTVISLKTSNISWWENDIEKLRYTFLIQFLQILIKLGQSLHLVIKLHWSIYTPVTLQTVVQEITVPFVIETVFWLYYFITTNICIVYIKKIVPHISSYFRFSVFFINHCKLSFTKFLITHFNKISPKGWLHNKSWLTFSFLPAPSLMLLHVEFHLVLEVSLPGINSGGTRQILGKLLWSSLFLVKWNTFVKDLWLATLPKMNYLTDIS